MVWECFEDKHTPGSWRVEATDFEDEGKVYVVEFSGPDAESRAREYAMMKNGTNKKLRVA